MNNGKTLTMEEYQYIAESKLKWLTLQVRAFEAKELERTSLNDQIEAYRAAYGLTLDEALSTLGLRPDELGEYASNLYNQVKY